MRVSTSSRGPVERLWSLVGDLDRWDVLLPTMDSVRALDPTRSPGVGARYAVRQPRLARAVYEVTDWRPGETFTWVARAPGLTTTAWHDVRPDGAGSRLDLGLDWSGPLAPLVRAAFGGRARRMVELEAETFARLAEAGSD